MTEAANGKRRSLSTLAHVGHVEVSLAAAGLLVLFWCPCGGGRLSPRRMAPLTFTTPAVLSESMAGHGPSTSVYRVSWQPVPNWGGPLLLVGLLKIVPLSLVPRLVLSITALLPVLATLLLRRQAGGSHGLLWAAAIAGCLGTGRRGSWDLKAFPSERPSPLGRLPSTSGSAIGSARFTRSRSPHF